MKNVLRMGLSKNTLFEDVNWIAKIEKKLIKVGTLFNIGRSEHRGWDPMFYPYKGHSIEKEYIKK